MSRLYPLRKLGQNFLNSRHYAERIVEFANIKKDIVVEIGAGKGALTKLLGNVASLVYAVEIDRRLLDELRSVASANTIIVNQDFLKTNLDDFENPVIIGNIPYPLSSQIYEKLAFESNKYKRAVITVQKEFLDRMLAPIRSRKYGPLSLMTAYFFKVIKGFEIPGRFFRPSPAVLSIVIALERKKQYQTKAPRELFDFIKDCFRHRRKSINKRITPELARDLIGGLGRRPQELSLDQWIEIYDAIVSKQLGQ